MKKGMGLQIAAGFLLLLSLIFIANMIMSSRVERALLHAEDKQRAAFLFQDLQLKLSQSLMPGNDYLITGEADEAESFEELQAEIASLIVEIQENNTVSPEQLAFLAYVEKEFVELSTIAGRIFALTNPIGNPLGGALMEEMDEVGDALIDRAGEEAEAIRLAIEEELHSITEDVDKNQLYLIALLLAAVAWTLYVAYKIGVRVAGTSAKMIQGLAMIEKGQLTSAVSQHLQDKGNDEMGTMLRGLDTMRGNLAGLVARLKNIQQEMDEGAASIATATVQSQQVAEALASSVGDMSSQVSEQANEIHSISAAMETASQESEAGRQSGSAALRSVENFSAAIEATNRVVSAFKEKTQAITEIMSMIIAISEQTKLLALNASIEAARAGDSGKGFAVVADEVRKLAEASERSIRQIDDLMKEVHKVVESSTSEMSAVLQHSGESKNNIENAVTVFDTVMNSFANAVERLGRLSTIAQESAASVQEFAASVQEQAAGTEEVAAVAENLRGLSDTLSRDMSTFQID